MSRLPAFLAVATVLLATACGPAAATSPDALAREPHGARAVVGQALVDARTAARRYGRQHLGHYLDLDEAALGEVGFRPPEGVTVTVRAEHVGFCLVAEHTDLAAGDPWRVATIDGRSVQPSTDDRC